MRRRFIGCLQILGDKKWTNFYKFSDAGQLIFHVTDNLGVLPRIKKKSNADASVKKNLKWFQPENPNPNSEIHKAKLPNVPIYPKPTYPRIKQPSIHIMDVVLSMKHPKHLNVDTVILMLNNIAPYNKMLCTIINTLNKFTTTCSIYFANSLFWILKFLKTWTHALQVALQNGKGQIHVEDRWSNEGSNPRFSPVLCKTNESITISSSSVEILVTESQFCLTMLKTLICRLLFSVFKLF